MGRHVAYVQDPIATTVVKDFCRNIPIDADRVQLHALVAEGFQLIGRSCESYWFHMVERGCEIAMAEPGL
jgi:hypothetical protein